MIVAAERIADVVQQGHHYILFVAPVAVRACSGLQRMLEPADGKAAEIAIEKLEMVQHTVRQSLGKSAVFAADDRPVFGRAFLHLAEFCPFGGRMFDVFLNAHRVSLSFCLLR